MALTILKGTIVSAPALGQLAITAHGYLVAEDGIINGVYPVLPQQYTGADVEDFGEDLIVQSFADLHLHAPQYPMLGTGMDLPLLDWLNHYAFPTEARFADPVYARTLYHQLAQELIAGGTTRVCMFSSLHTDATLILMDELEKAGVTGYVGKVNMDQNGLPGVLEETTDSSIKETIRWLDACQDFHHIKPILTPRFIPSCSDKLLKFLGKLALDRQLPIQSHLSENQQEIAWVRELQPDCPQYWDAYKKYGLWNQRTVMAHCVWSDPRERKAIANAGVTAVHCADSNQNLCSGFAPVRQMLREGLKIALGSDIAGGDHLSMFDVIAASVRSSKAHRILDQWQSDFLTVPEAWYLGTSAGSAYFGEAPGFAAGNPLHAIVLSDSNLPQPHPLTPEERLSRSVYLRQPNAIREVWSCGRKVYSISAS